MFYLDITNTGQPRVYPGRVIEARVIAVAEKVVRIEAFGVECSILARDLSYDWLGNAHDLYHVGDKILIRINEIIGDSTDELKIKADVKSVIGDSSREKLKHCKVQGKYVGSITDIHKGVVFIRLNIGINAVAHTCYDRRTPAKMDMVSFVVTKIDEERGVAVGIITRIIKQNI